MFDVVEDYATTGQNPLAFARYYNSMSVPDTYATAIGQNWRHGYDRFLHIVNPSAIYGVIAEREDGRYISFSSNAGTYTTDSDIDFKLTKSGSTWTLTTPDDTVETYTASGDKGTLNSVKLRNGYTQTMAYTSGRLSSVSDSYSRSLGLSYTSMGLLSTVTTPDSLTLSYGYVTFSSAKRLTTVSYNTSPVTKQTYLYENASYPYALTGITDENNQRYVTWTYDDSGRATSSKMGASADLTQINYVSNGDRTVTGPLGIQETYKFTYLQGVPKVTQVNRAANGTVAPASRLFTYDTNGYLKTSTDWNGNLTAYTNNTRGDPTQIIYASGSTVTHTTTITYDATWPQLPATISEPGLLSALTYSSTGNVTFRSMTDKAAQTVPYATHGQNRILSYSWSPTGQLRTVQLPRTDVTAKTTYAYSGGTLTSITDAASQVSTVSTYKPGGLPLTMRDQNNVLTTLAYSPRLWLTSSVVTTSAGNLTTSFIYDSAGNLTRQTLPDSTYLAYTYDDAHRVTKLTNALSETQNLTLNAAGNVTQSIWRNTGGTRKWQHDNTFDALGRMKTDVGGQSQTTTFAYDSQGNILTVTDPLAHASTQTFDALNRLKTFTDAATNLTQYAYDAHDRPLTVTDPRGKVTSYVYNGFGDVIQVTSPDTGTTVYSYDKDGNVSQKTDATGAVTNYTYDALDRLLTRTYPADSTLNVSLTYDQAGHGKGIGQLTSATDQAGSLSLSYDHNGAVTINARTIGATAYTTNYGYNAAGRLSSITYPGAAWVVSYTRDAAGQVSAVKVQPPGGSLTNLATLVKHMPFGPVYSFTYGNGATDTRSFDYDYRMTNVTDTGTATVQNLTYTYDAGNNVKTITDAVTSANNQTLNYDAVDRLKSATGSYGTVSSITYDSNGNRLTYGATSYTIPAANNKMSNAGGTAIGYNATGNVTSIGASTFTYNKANQLSAIGSVTQAYDYNGWRQKSVSGGTTYVNQYNQDGRATALFSGAVADNYVYLDDAPLYVIQPATSTLSAIHTDRIGTPQKATNASTTVVWAGAYQPFGAVTPSPATVPQSMRFPGQTTESGGYYFNLYRDYNPAWGRYLQADPIGLEGGINPYDYALSNPYKWTDILGLISPTPRASVPASSPIAIDELFSRFNNGGGTANCIVSKPKEQQIQLAGDGGVFGNREGLLPSQAIGYYSIMVLPTPGIKGAGPRRLIRGQQGEIYYTPDHYKTFYQMR